MSDSIGSATTAGTQAPSLAQLVAARDSAPDAQTDPIPTDKVSLSPEAQSTVDEGAKSVAQKMQAEAQASLNPIKQIANQSSDQASSAPKSIHVVA